MAMHGTRHGTEKRRRPKKSKSRSVVDISSSESDTNDEQWEDRKLNGNVEEDAMRDKATIVKQTRLPALATPQEDANASMPPSNEPFSLARSVSAKETRPPRSNDEEFAFTYLRNVTAELADDLDKVREAKDFSSSSLSVLIHALKQGESIYSREEKRRVLSTANE